VWAINPRRDSLTDVVQRMRRFASDVLTAKGIAFTLDAPDGDRIRLGADVRRHLYLVFKESINNLARHSGAAAARIDLRIDRGRLVLRIEDDGAGFDPAAPHAGHGLASMRDRARAIGGVLDVISAAGRGTRLRLEIPLGLSARPGGRRAPRRTGPASGG
jgi:signal transduction histidine kinase